MFERYTERARRVIFFARYEASQFGSMTIETEHLLLGLLREDRNIISRFLHLASSPDNVRALIESRFTIREKVPTSVDLPLSMECKRILAYAAEEAERLLHRHIGTEHLLLGIFREEKCVAAEVLQQLGIGLDAIRQELARSTMRVAQHGTPSPQENEPEPGLLKAILVPDEDTAKRIAEAVWIAQYGADIVASQAPFKAELKFNVWIVTGSPSSEAALFAWILQMDGRVLSIGRRTEP